MSEKIINVSVTISYTDESYPAMAQCINISKTINKTALATLSKKEKHAMASEMFQHILDNLDLIQKEINT